MAFGLPGVVPTDDEGDAHRRAHQLLAIIENDLMAFGDIYLTPAGRWRIKFPASPPAGGQPIFTGADFGDGGEGGEMGPPGPPGAQGPAGAPGVAGSAGAPGILGMDGMDGEMGDWGPPGPPGTGAAGPTGATGAGGPPGQPGLDGLDGVDGIDGLPGPAGPQGAAGAAGAAGPQGPAGPPGLDGLDGLDGERGPPGERGPTGPQGPAGGGGGSLTEVEVDFGSVPVYDAQFTITDALIATTSKVVIQESGKPATGRVAGDAQWDSIVCAANPATGSATVYAIAHPGPVVGKRTLHYSVA